MANASGTTNDLQFVAVALDVPDPVPVAAFWAGLLDRTPVAEPGGVLLPGDERQVGLRFVRADTLETGSDRLHLHVTSATPEDQQRLVDLAISLGGRHLDVGQRPEEGHIVLADPGGNALCVIEPGSTFLAGCGPLGEVACDGTRDVGVFWSAALAWPLVWDQDEETAVQAPAGGTKVAWGGPPVEPKHGRNRQRFDLATSDVAAAVDRLAALGAAELARYDSVVELADPDGNEFTIIMQ